MISAVCWVPKGAQKKKPLRFEISNDEIETLQRLENELEDQEEEEEETKKGGREIADDGSELPPELNMDKYDDDEDITPELLADAGLLDDNAAGGMEDGEESDEMEHMNLIEDVQTGRIYADDSDDSDAEDYEIRPNDSIMIVAKTELDDDYSSLEVQIYDDNEGNIYTHHDISLPAFPLSIAWMNCPPYPLTQDESGNAIPTSGSFIAVGTFNPAIEIWNLDVIDALEPSAMLGGEAQKKKEEEKEKDNICPRKPPRSSLRAFLE